ncbi:MAG: amino acid ABC transporter substrate-binding protein [Caldilineales bacterium]|nr:amino acid ABC transporter substrate-binding protein [Caldilineales bacterium]
MQPESALSSSPTSPFLPAALRWAAHPHRGAPTRTALWLLSVALILTACAPRATPPVFKIAIIAPFEGPSRPLGYSILHAVRLRVQAWNASMPAPKIEIIALNDDGDPELAARLPAQLALDPAVLLVLGPPQGHTARAALGPLAAWGLPTLALAPLPGEDEHTGPPAPAAVIPFAGDDSRLAAALADVAGAAAVAWQLPLATPSIWVGDPLTLAELLITRPELAAAAGSVAAEPALVAWAPLPEGGLIWAAAAPAALPADFIAAYTAAAGEPPTPMAGLAFAAVDAALPLLAQNQERAALGLALAELPLPPFHRYLRSADACCQPLP